VKTLITGASGFVGRYLVRLLLERHEEELYCIGDPGVENSRLRSMECDITDEKSFLPLVKKIAPQRIYHLAGIAKVTDQIGMPEYFSKNFLTTVALIDAVKEFNDPVFLFFTSTVHVYGNQEGMVTETSLVHPVSPYGFTKYLAEEALRYHVHHLPHLHVVVARLNTCIGPGQPEGFVASDFCKKIIRLKDERTETLRVGPLSGYRSFLDVRDCVSLFPALLEVKHSSRYEIFNVATPNAIQVRRILEILLSISGKSATIQSSEDTRSNKFTGTRPSIEKLKATAPSITFRPIEETLKDIYEWEKTNTSRSFS